MPKNHPFSVGLSMILMQLLRYPGYCTPAVSALVLFLSLACGADWIFAPHNVNAGTPRALRMDANALAAALDSSLPGLQGRAAGPYTVNSSAAVTPDTYTNIILQSPATRINIGSGTVTLTGGNGLLWDTTTAGNASADQLVLRPNEAADATLVLTDGEASGNIRLQSGSFGGAYYGSNMLIGPGDDKASGIGDVTISGRIDGAGSVAQAESGRNKSTLETQGANLNLNGAIGTSTGNVLGRINAYNGNVTVTPLDSLEQGADYTVSAGLISINSGFHLEIAAESSAAQRNHKGVFADAIELPDNTYIKSAGEIDIARAIGDTSAAMGGGFMSKGARLETTDYIFLWEGVKKAAGLMKAGHSIITYRPEGRLAPVTETLLPAIVQGGSDPLVLEADGDVLAGNISVDTISAGRHILAGSSIRNTSSIPADRIFFNAYGDGNYSPRSTLNANKLTAGSTIMAGEVNLPLDASEGSLTASNLFLPKLDADTLAATSGNITIKNGSLNLSGTDNLNFSYKDASDNIHAVTRDFPSQIEGSMTITGNRSSSFTALKVGETASVERGEISGAKLVANGARFTDVANMTITDTLEITTTLTASGNGASSVKNTIVGGAAAISGGTWSGTDFTAGSASFDNVQTVNMAGIAKIGGDLTSTANGASTFAHLKVGGAINVSGGSFAGGDITVDGSVTASDNLFSANTVTTGAATRSGGDFTLNNGQITFQNDSAIHGNLTLNGNQGSTFANLKVDGAANISGGYLSGQDLSASTASFTGGVIANLDELALTDTDLSLVIDSGAIVTVKSYLNNPSGVHAIGEGKLIIIGDGEPTHIDVLNINDKSSVYSEYGRFDIGEITGTAEGEPDNLRLGSVQAGSIAIGNVNFEVVGLGDNKSTVHENLIIHQNGNSQLGDMDVGGYVEIDGGTVRAHTLNVGKQASFNGVNLALLGTGDNASSIGGDLTITNNLTTRLGDIAVTGHASISGGSLSAASLTAKSSAFENADSLIGSLTSPDGASFTGGRLEAGKLAISDGDAIFSNGVEVVLPGADDNRSVIGGTLKTNGGIFNAMSLAVANDAVFDGTELRLPGTGTNRSAIGGDLSILNNTNGNTELGDMEIGKTATISGGNFVAGNLNIASGLIMENTSPSAILGDLTISDNKESRLGDLTVTKTAGVSKGTLNAESLTAQNAAFTAVESSVDKLTLSGDGTFDQGSLTVTDNLTAQNAMFRNGITATLNELVMKSGTLAVGGDTDSIGNTSLQIATLNLNGASMQIGDTPAGPAIAAVKSIGQSGGDINGNIGIGLNGRLVLGEASYTLNRDAGAVFVLSQPMSLGAGYGIHVAGEGAASPVASQIRFDSGSLFVIDADARKAGVIYNYLGSVVPSTDLSATKGAVGALSAEQGTVQANVNNGSQIYIRNPVANTVVVALGVNIKTSYQDKATRARAASGAPWTGANLDYDNKDKVKISRLENEYAGQFLVLPLGADSPFEPDTPDTPDNPTTPDNPAPAPDTPEQPATPGNPTTPDNPATPGNPATPDNPSPAPDTPEQPATPDSPLSPAPNQPAPSTPASPASPAAPHPSTSHPGAHPGIHDAIQNAQNQGTVGTEDHQLVTHHGAGFLSHTLVHYNPHRATRLVEGASRMLVLGAVPQLALSANTAAATAMEQRVELASILDEQNIYARSIALWAVPLYRASNAWSLDAGSHEYDYNGGIGGIAVGGDITFADTLRAGLAFNIGGGYSKSSGDLPETTNSMSFWGVGAYAGGAIGNLGLAADVSFTSSYNKLKQDISVLNGWNELKGDAQAYALSAGFAVEYLFRSSLLDIIPHAGFKYHYLHIDDYELRHNGHSIIDGNGLDQNIWTFPLGVSFAKDLELGNGWQLRPGLDFRITPASGDIETKTITRFTATDLDVELKTKIMDYMTAGGTASLDAKCGDFTIGVRYSLEAGAHATYSTILGAFSYEF